jgi:hypothetical protein
MWYWNAALRKSDAAESLLLSGFITIELPEESSQIILTWHKINFGVAVLQSFFEGGYPIGRFLAGPDGRMIMGNIESVLPPAGYSTHRPRAQGRATCKERT